jgi:ABC-type transporter Mla MlaB component
MEAAAPKTVAFAIRGPIARDDLEGLCARVCSLLAEARAGVAFCDVARVEPNAVCVDALARLQLGAKHYACKVRLRNATPALRELVAFMGLADVLLD